MVYDETLNFPKNLENCSIILKIGVFIRLLIEDKL